MFFDQDSRRESFECIVVEDRDSSLEQDRAAVEIFVDEVDRAARDFCAVRESLILRIEAGESGQQRRVDIQDAIGKLRNEVSAQEPHITSQTNPIHAVLPK